MQCALHILHVVVALFDHFVYFPMRFCSIMMKENILVLSTSIYIFCNHFQVRERAGYALFHVVCKYQDRSKCSAFIGSVDKSKKFEITSNGL